MSKMNDRDHYALNQNIKYGSTLFLNFVLFLLHLFNLKKLLSQIE